MNTIFKAIILTVSSLLERKLKLGDLIDRRYEIIQFLGKGSYGYSYLVYDRNLQKCSVLKILRWHKRKTVKGNVGFNNEIELLRTIEHPSVPAYFSHGNFEGIPYFTMEYIEGKTFEQLIFQEGIIYSEVEAFQWGLELLGIISVLHAQQIIHRDLRIPNIMLQENELRIIDFGLARQLGDVSEKSIDLRKEISPHSDYYSLGHFILFLLYSGYQAPDKVKEKPWDEELEILLESKNVIRRLLQISEPYQSNEEIKRDFIQVINLIKEKGGKQNVFI